MTIFIHASVRCINNVCGFLWDAVSLGYFQLYIVSLFTIFLMYGTERGGGVWVKKSAEEFSFAPTAVEEFVNIFHFACQVKE